MNLILFDGVCNLCNGFVQFIIKKDKAEIFMFSALQSDYAKTVLNQHAVHSARFDTVFYFDGEKLHAHSDAAILILAQLPRLRGIRVFLHIPKGIRDSIYRFISKNRYTFFGRREACMIPSPQLLKRFKS